MLIDILKELDYLEKQLGQIEIIAAYSDQQHTVELGRIRDQYYLKLNGSLVKLGRDCKELISDFYGQIARIYEDKQSGIDPQFANLRDILISRNKFVQESLEKLGEGKLSKLLSQLNFNTEVSSRSIMKQLDSLDEPESITEELQDSPVFQNALDVILSCEKCPKPYVPGKGVYDDEGDTVVSGPKPNLSGHFTYESMDNDINMSTKAVILNTKGEVLVLKDAYSEYWDLPGGHINDGETIEMGLKREVKEETGLTITAYTQRFARELLLGDPPPRIVVFFIASVVGEVNLSEEHTGAAWLPYDKLETINLGKFLPIIQQLMREVLPVPDYGDEDVFKQGHEMEVTDLGQPYYHQKHHDSMLGDPNEVDNVQTQRHDVGQPEIRISTVKDVMRDHIEHSDNPVLVKVAYSEAGGPDYRERPFIEPEGNASTSYEAGYIVPFSSAAQVDNEPIVEKQAAGGAGVAGEGSGAVGTTGALTTGDTFTPTHGGQEKRKQDFDSSLTQKQDHPSTFAGAFEGTTQRPDVDAYAYENQRKDPTSRYDMPAEQQPLGEGENNLWLSGEEQSPNIRKVVVEDGLDRPRLTNEPKEQFTNLSMDMLKPFLQKSADTLEDEELGILSADIKERLDKGKPLVVAGYGNVSVADREGHLITIDALREALPKFMARPEYRNANIFHSGVQVGIILDKFVDSDGKVWTTHVDNKGLFVVLEFRTDIEVARKAMAEVLKGNLRGFSLAGNSDVTTATQECKHGICYKVIHDLEIYEVTLCATPVNQESYITHILQKPSLEECPDCYVNVSSTVKYDSALRPIR